MDESSTDFVKNFGHIEEGPLSHDLNLEVCGYL